MFATAVSMERNKTSVCSLHPSAASMGNADIRQLAVQFLSMEKKLQRKDAPTVPCRKRRTDRHAACTNSTSPINIRRHVPNWNGFIQVALATPPSSLQPALRMERVGLLEPLAISRRCPRRDSSRPPANPAHIAPSLPSTCVQYFSHRAQSVAAYPMVSVP